METNKQRTQLLLSVIAAGVLFFVTLLIFPFQYYHNLLTICADGASAATVILAALSVLSSKHRKVFLIAAAAALCFVAFSIFSSYTGIYTVAVALISAFAAVLAVLQVTRRQRAEWSKIAFAACLCIAITLAMLQSGRWGELFPVLLLGIVWIRGILRHRCPHVGVFTLLAAVAVSALSLYEISRSYYFHGDMRGSYVWFIFLQIILEAAWPVLLAFAVQPKADAVRREKTASLHVLCPQCGGSNESGTKFCIFCGAPLSAVKAVRSCPVCGAECHSQAKFCPACGKPLTAPEQPVKGNPPDADENKQMIQ